MKILLDECIDHRFRFELADYEVKTVSFMEWNAIQNGALIKRAEQEFDVFITVDANIKFQQNLSNLDLAILILRPTQNKLHFLSDLLPQVKRELSTIKPGDVVSVSTID